MYNSNKDLQTKTISAAFKLTNKGSETINLEKVKLQYFFTNDAGSIIQNIFYCDTFIKMGNTKYRFLSQDALKR